MSVVVKLRHGGLHDGLQLEIVWECEEDGEDDAREGEQGGGPQPPVTQLVERVDHREVSLQRQGDRHVDAGSQAGLSYGQAEGNHVEPHTGGELGAEVGQGEGEEGGDQEQAVHHGQHQHQPASHAIIGKF